MQAWLVSKVVFLVQILPTFGGRCNRYFRDIRLKILRLPIFNMLFQLVLTKFFKVELFSCLPKVDHVIKSCKEPIGQLCIGGHGYSSRTVTDRHWLQCTIISNICLNGDRSNASYWTLQGNDLLISGWDKQAQTRSNVLRQVNKRHQLINRQRSQSPYCPEQQPPNTIVHQTAGSGSIRTFALVESICRIKR